VQQTADDNHQAPASLQPPQAVITTDDLSCSRFEWNEAKDVMRVPISLDGKPYWYQLDTGADVVMTYGEPSMKDGLHKEAL